MPSITKIFFLSYLLIIQSSLSTAIPALQSPPRLNRFTAPAPSSPQPTTFNCTAAVSSTGSSNSTTTSYLSSSSSSIQPQPTQTFTPEPTDGNELTCLRNYSGCLEAHGDFNIKACETEALACLDEVPGSCLRWKR